MSAVCERCGAFGDMPHAWIEGDCVISHTDHEEPYVGRVCRRHYHWIDDVLRQILELYVLLPDVIQPGSGPADGRPSGAVFAPAPARLDVLAITDRRAKTPIDLEPGEIPDLPGTLSSWAERVRTERGGLELDGTVTCSVRYLRRERHWIAQQPDVTDLVLELDWLHRGIAHAVGDTMWPRPIGVCPNCQTKLYNSPSKSGIDEVTCRKCKTTWRGVDLARLRLIHEQEASR